MMVLAGPEHSKSRLRQKIHFARRVNMFAAFKGCSEK